MIFQLKKKPKRRPIVLGVPSVEESADKDSGPTCLAQIYRLHGFERSRATVIERTRRAPDGRILAPHLGLTALEDGLGCEIYSCNLRVFDPTWRDFPDAELAQKLRARREAVDGDSSLQELIGAYIEFIEAGGDVQYHEPTRELITGLLHEGLPVIARINATYLYGTPREFGGEYEDVRGEAVLRYVVVSGYFPKSGRFIVHDSSPRVPARRLGRYSARWDRFISATLADVTADGPVLLAVRPR